MRTNGTNRTVMNRRQMLQAGASLTAVAAAGIGAPSLAHGLTPGAASSDRLEDGSAELLAQWRAAPGSHPVVPDVSRAGYRLGAEPPHPRVVARVTDFGAESDGRDCVEAFNEAVRSVGESGGGTIFVPPGEYVLSGPLWIHWSNVVLRGAGPDATVLHFSRPLKESWVDHGYWQHSGGQIWVIPEEQKPAQGGRLWPGGPPLWIPGDVLAEVAPASRGQATLLVSDTSGLSPGDMVLLECPRTADASLFKHIAGDIAGAETFPWDTATGLFGRAFEYLWWPVRIEAVLGERLVLLAQPVKYDLRSDWPAELRAIGPAVRETGVERLTIRNEFVPQPAHHAEFGYNGLCFQVVHDCWARDVRIQDCDNGFNLTGAKSVTLTDVSVGGGRGGHHSVNSRVQSHDNLLENFTIGPFDPPVPPGASHHGITVATLSSGNVHRGGEMDEGTFDYHGSLAFENVFTDITINNIGRTGGAINNDGLGNAAPRCGARNVHWNLRVTNGRRHAMTIADLAPRSASVGIQGVDQPVSDIPANYQGDHESIVVDFGQQPSIADLYLTQRADADS